MPDKKVSLLYRFIRWLVRLFSPKMKVEGLENLPDEPVIAVGNHTQMFGPIAGELYYPGRHYIWCAGQMMHLKEVPGYAFEDFWSFKPKSVRWLFKIASYLIAPLAVCIFNNAHTIAVYHDTRIITTFRETLTRLQEGNSVVIFPEKNERYNNILYAFQDKFIDLGRMYYKKTGKVLSFVPMYIAPYLKTMYLGKPIPFDPAAPVKEERTRICALLMDAITDMAVSLPEHTVVPYRNIGKKNYPKNRPLEVYADENAGR